MRRHALFATLMLKRMDMMQMMMQTNIGKPQGASKTGP